MSMLGLFKAGFTAPDGAPKKFSLVHGEQQLQTRAIDTHEAKHPLCRLSLSMAKTERRV